MKVLAGIQGRESDGSQACAAEIANEFKARGFESAEAMQPKGWPNSLWAVTVDVDTEGIGSGVQQLHGQRVEYRIVHQPSRRISSVLVG